MTDFEKIIFLADKIEKRTREVEHRAPIEKALEKGIIDELAELFNELVLLRSRDINMINAHIQSVRNF